MSNRGSNAYGRQVVIKALLPVDMEVTQLTVDLRSTPMLPAVRASNPAASSRESLVAWEALEDNQDTLPWMPCSLCGREHVMAPKSKIGRDPPTLCLLCNGSGCSVCDWSGVDGSVTLKEGEQAWLGLNNKTVIDCGVDSQGDGAAAGVRDSLESVRDQAEGLVPQSQDVPPAQATLCGPTLDSSDGPGDHAPAQGRDLLVSAVSGSEASLAEAEDGTHEQSLDFGGVQIMQYFSGSQFRDRLDSLWARRRSLDETIPQPEL